MMEGHYNCWCKPCREANLDRYSTFDVKGLLRMFQKDLRDETSDALDQTFAVVMRRIVAAKAFKVVAQRVTHYKQVKRQLQELGYDQDRVKILARRINNSCWVFKNFNKIVSNLELCSLLDIRRLSLKELYLAKNMHWCLARQELARERLRGPDDIGVHRYRDDDFYSLLESVKSSACYQSLIFSSKGIVQINRSFNSESKMKDSCGCKIIIPVTGFECYLCKMFIRNENDIEDHIASFQHLTIYEIHLQEHNQVQDSINPNQIDVNGKCLTGEIISISNDNLKERNTVENSSERNLLHDGIRPEENDAVGRNAEEPTSKRTVLNGNDRELSRSNIVDATEVSRIGDLGMQNFDGNLSNNQAPSCNGQEQDASGNIKKYCFDESDSDQIARDSRSNTLMDEAEREGRFDGGQVKLEVSDGNDIELRRNLPTTKDHAKDNDQCNNGKISLEGTEDVCETFIKEEQHDDCHDDDGDADGIIGGFLEDSIDDTHDNDEHCKGELMPEYTYNRESPTDSIQPCATATTTSGEQCQPTVTSQSPENQAETTYTDEISKTGIEMNLEISRDVNSNINTCVVDTEHPQKGSYKGRKSALNEKSFANVVDETSSNLIINLKVHERKYTREKAYSCDVCGMKFASSINCKRHKKIHADARPFPCILCGKSFKYRGNFEAHERIHTGKRPFSCKVCRKSFRRNGDLIRHERVHTGEKPYLCNVCGKSFKQHSSLTVHNRIHTGEKPYVCNLCGKPFRTNGHLKGHKSVHLGSKPYLCNVCGKSFKQTSHLKVHERIHTREKLLTCNDCGKLFTTCGDLEVHEKIHAERRPFLCKLCGKSFKTSGHLEKHEKVHTGQEPFSDKVCGKSVKIRGHENLLTEESPFSCSVCGKLFQRGLSLARHKEIHTGRRPYSCNVCGKSFRRNGDLILHERIHTGEEPYSCNVCGKSFKQHSNLKVHTRIHTGEKPYVCNLCGKPFRTSSHLKGHESMHLGRKPFLCEICGLSFKQRNILKRHQAVHISANNFSCKICGQSFKTRGHLKRHKKRRAREWP